MDTKTQETVALSMELALLCIKAGAKEFSQFAEAVKTDMESDWDRLKDDLHIGWNRVCETDSSLRNISDTDAANIVKKLSIRASIAGPTCRHTSGKGRKKIITAVVAIIMGGCIAAWVFGRISREMATKNGPLENDPAARKSWRDYAVVVTNIVVRNLQELAEQGDSNAQFKMGCRYFLGNGIAQDYTKALEWLNKAAAQGNSGAQAALGAMYAEGDGVTQDHTQAAEWFRKAAEQGLSIAQVSLGSMYADGIGVAQDDRQAVEWYRKAAEQGDADAQFHLGWRYLHGEGVTQSNAKAFEWYSKAAEQGNSSAQRQTGWMYDSGTGVIKDERAAVMWYSKSAEQGDGLAHLFLGSMYQFGKGAIQNDVQACVHYLIAGALGAPLASEEAEQLRNDRLSNAGYEAAQREANEWMISYQARMQGGESADRAATTGRANQLQSTGTGFLISADGYFLTCAHVVQNVKDIKVQLEGRTYNAQLVSSDTHNDVALLKLDGTGFEPVSIARDTPEMGNRVFTVGYPNPDIQGAAAKYTDGSISSLSGIMDDVRLMQITVPVQGGNSGGPLIDANGNVIGIVVAQIDVVAVFESTRSIPQNVNFAVKIHYALPLIQATAGLSQKLAKPRDKAADNRMIQTIKDATGLVLVYE